MNEVTFENGKIQIAVDVMKELQAFNEQKAAMELKEKRIKEAILQAMEENNIKSFENDFVSIKYIPQTTRKSVDTAKMKEEGVYDVYLKESEVKSQVRLTWKSSM